MKKTGAELVRHALEQLGIRHTFGIPGVHNTEIYDQLASSEVVTPIRVNHEGCGAFMADAVSRTNDFNGALLIVPAAGTALAMAGIGEAYLDGVPMLVISGGTRTDTGYTYQLHELDQLELVKPFTKGAWRITEHRQIVPTFYEAWRLANSGEPGPVFIEIPVNLQLFPGEIDELPVFVRPEPHSSALDEATKVKVKEAAQLLKHARKPGLFLGWGGVHGSMLTQELAELLQAPVSTTLQGLSAFPAQHPLHAGMSMGPAAVPAAENAFADCDVLLAIGTRFGEIATGSFGIKPTWDLIHVDINPAVFNANYDARLCIEGDAKAVVSALIEELKLSPGNEMQIQSRGQAVRQQIAKDKRAYMEEWLRHDSGQRVNPGRFFQALRSKLPDDGYLVTDDGNHTFLVAELFETRGSRHLITPTDFNCMGYCVPAAVGIKLTHPDKQVVGIVGDGAFLMTGLELLTATENKLGVVCYVFNDGELSQISQAQKLPYNRKACTVLPEVRFKGIADAVGAHYLRMAGDADIAAVIDQAQALSAQGVPVIVDVLIDYSKQTRFTKGILRTNLMRMDMGNKLRMIGRAAWRRVATPN
ncbi:MAG: thiamine pyrophosphate-binding protein [Aquabacterium sp.]|uniref:thiamine pyrophosphate-binding protein n=1 Tax=Aquabacterium sp. TaxID=1872578 RepID=UPI0025B938EE|nr:thiamine pyrophosphate-binding protein [Aquabacterium sp.]MBI5926941.1 thiamine pyrophosphate-binding protein [Aquabacterium sp.]